jgi:hypothetical protein
MPTVTSSSCCRPASGQRSTAELAAILRVVDTAIVGQIASQGLLGVLLVVTGLAYWNKDKALTDERNARIADAKAYNDLALKLQAQVIDSVNKVSEILDEMKKIMPPARREPR